VQPTKTNQRPFGTVRKLPSGRFQARWTGPDGFTHTGPETYPTRDAAKDWLAGERTARARDEWIDDRISGVAFSSVAQTWADRRAGGGYRVGTWTRDVEYLDRYVLPRWADTSLSGIEADEIEDWYIELAARGGLEGAPLAATTVKMIAQIFRNVLGAAVRAKRLFANPAKGVPLPRDANPKEMMCLDPAQIDDLADALGAWTFNTRGELRPALKPHPQWRTFVLTGCYCGLRVGELLALRARDVDLERRRIDVRRIVVEVKGVRHVGQPKTKAGIRSVPFPRALRAELAAALERCDHPDDLVFPNTEGNYVGLSTFRSRLWKPAIAAADLAGFRIHDMRHTAISLWIAAKRDPKEIATWAGHTSTVIVFDRYGHLFEHDDDPMGALDDLLRRRRRRPATITPIRGR